MFNMILIKTLYYPGTMTGSDAAVFVVLPFFDIESVAPILIHDVSNRDYSEENSAQERK